MSAWIVSKGHIDCLVQALIVEGIVAREDADEVGQVLWHENHLSIEARYGDEPNTPEYHFRGVDEPLDDAIVWMQLGCYGYQTCEHARWRDRTIDARRWHDQLDAVYQRRYGCGHAGVLEGRLDRGLPWGIQEIEEAIARKEASQ